MSRATLFEFCSYKFEPKKRRAVFKYKTYFADKKALIFTETAVFPRKINFKKIPAGLIKELLQDVHTVLGISYYKLFIPPKILLHRKLSREQADFWNTIYKKGLGEFFYRNKLNPARVAKFYGTKKVKPFSWSLDKADKVLLGLGGGKDSITALELFKKEKGLSGLSAFVVDTNDNAQLISAIASKAGLPLIKIQRFLDKQLLDGIAGSFGGHIPISAIYGFLGLMAAVFYGYSYIVVANEYSSAFGNVRYRGLKINHQWSKSEEFERLFQHYIFDHITQQIVYFSALRPFYEIRIAKMFASLKRYFPYFSGCNKNFSILKKSQILWCGNCPKCVFSFIILSPFLSKKVLVKIFGHNFFNDTGLLGTIRDLLGFGRLKPFDCVGTFEESRAAIYLASRKFKDDIAIKKFLPKLKITKDDINNLFKACDASSIPDRFRFLGMDNVLIAGYGKEGRITHRYLKKYYPRLRVGIADRKQGRDYLSRQDKYDIAIKTPGIQSRLISIPHTTATNIFFSKVSNYIIGITGSKGKSTTTSLIYSILRESGRRVYLLGNIGNPMLAVLIKSIEPNAVLAIELSSYQLDDIKYSPDIAVVLNLFPDHMNYHGGVGEYYDAKHSIVRFQGNNDFFIYNGGYQELKSWARNSFSRGIDFNIIKLPVQLETTLIGRHNLENIKAAIAVARTLAIPDKTIFSAIKKFKSLLHRLELIGQYRGIRFYDDAISTTPESTIAAIESLREVDTIMLGGEDRGYDFTKLEMTIRHFGIKNIVLFPETGRRMFKQDQGLNTLFTSNMAEAVQFAYKYTTQGKICLLSTASPSYSLWKNFEEKGDQFRFFVEKYSRQ